MDKKKDSGSRLEKFFAGKGFYIVLFFCVAVIAVSTWILIGTSGKTTDVADNTEAIADYADVISTGETESVATAGRAEPAAAPTAEPTAAPETTPEAKQPAFEETPPVSTQTILEPDAEIEESTEVWSEESAVIQSDALFVWPVPGEVENGYSVTTLVYNRTMADWRTHDGLDISAELGTQVLASSGGVVESIYEDDLYGTTVVIAHANGLKSIYSNLASQPTVYEGDNVTVGEIIGSVGDTALCETNEITHLHFAMTCNGTSVDPMDYLPQR